MTADYPRKEKNHMTVFTIDAENNIRAFPDAESSEAAAGNGAQSFASQKELAKLAADWPAARLIETWNSFAGVVPLDHLKPVKKFTDRNTAVHRIWQAIQKLVPATETANVAPQGADTATRANAPAHSPTPQPRRPKAPKAATKSKGQRSRRKRNQASHAQVREGTKTAQVLTLIGRPKGATLSEIRKATGWQPHSVRGFISGTVGKKMGLAVESARREDGQRLYRLVGGEA